MSAILKHRFKIGFGTKLTLLNSCWLILAVVAQYVVQEQVAVTLPGDPATTIQQWTYSYPVWILTGIISVATLANFLIIRSCFTVPMQKLIGSIRDTGNPDFTGQEIRSPVTGEFGELAQVFNGVFSGLKKRNREMEEDMIQRERVSLELLNSEIRFRLMAQHIEEILWLCSADGKSFHYVSPAYEKIVGRSPQEVYNNPAIWLDDVHPEDRVEVIRDFTDKGIKGEKYTNTYRIHRPDGETRILCNCVFPIFDSNGNFSRIAGTIRDVTEQKKFEKALLKSEARLRKAQHIANLGFWEWDLHSNEIYWSREMYELCMVPSDGFNVSDNILRELVHPDDKDMVLGHFKEAIETGTSFNLIHRVVLPNGEVRYHNTYNEIIKDENGNRVKMLGTVADITQLKETEDALGLSNEMLRCFFESNLIGMTISTPEKGLIKCNDKICELTGYSREELADMTWTEFTHPDDRKISLEIFDRVLNGETNGYSIEKRYIRKDGEVIHVATSAECIRNPDGTVNYFFVMTNDITTRKIAEENLARLKRLYEHILNSAGEGIYGLDNEGNITFINPAAVEMLGYEMQELIGEPIHKLVHNSNDGHCDRDECLIEKAISDGNVYQVNDEFFQRSDDSSFPVEYVSTPIFDAQNSLSGTVVIFRDISARKQMETELQIAQKLEAVGQLAAGIAHEINTPAQYVGDNIRFLIESFKDIFLVINHYGELLDRIADGKLSDEHIDRINQLINDMDLEYLLEEIPMSLDQSQQGMENISTIVRAIKEFSHPGSDNQAFADINHIINTTCTVTRNEWKYVSEIKLELEEDIPSIRCNVQQLGQVLMNLIVNAAHAIGDVVRDGDNEQGTITISSRRSDNDIEIRVADTGNGIPDDIREKIFDPFFTTKDVGKGTGQGLGIVRSIIANHNGSISYESIEGAGTTFIIRLPMLYEDSVCPGEAA